MWQLYVETLLELHGNEAVRSKVEQKLNFVCQQAMEEKKLNESHLLDWVSSELNLIFLKIVLCRIMFGNISSGYHFGKVLHGIEKISLGRSSSTISEKCYSLVEIFEIFVG